MATVTLSTLRIRARQRADMELGSGQSDTDHFITNAELNTYINASLAELYDIIIKADGDYYLTSDTFSSTAGTLEYDLPSGFYKLKALEEQESTDKYKTIRKFNFEERNRGGLCYRIKGSKILFNQDPGGGKTYRRWYYPTFTALSSDGDTFDGINNWEEYVVVDAAIKMLTKEESDTTTLYAQKQELKQRIEQMSDDRDSGEPDSISSIRNGRFLDRYGWEMDD